MKTMTDGALSPPEAQEVPENKQVPLIIPVDWWERLEELKEHYAAAQWIRAVIYPFLAGRLRAEFGDDGRLIKVIGRDAEGRRVELIVEEGQRPIRRLPPLSPPPKMGRPKAEE